MKNLWNLVKREEGLESAEYAVLAGLIIPLIIVVVQAFGTSILNAFNRVAGSIP